MLFTGKSELSIDAKQRLAIPAKTRALLKQARVGEALYIIPGANGALWLMPERTFEEVAGQVEPTLTPAAEQMDFDELTFPEAHRLELAPAAGPTTTTTTTTITITTTIDNIWSDARLPKCST